MTKIAPTIAEEVLPTGVRIVIGDARERLADLPDCAFDCVVTSPPYFGLRDYDAEGQIGLEKTPDAYIEQLVTVFREVRRVLRDDGTLWLNLGDSLPGLGARRATARRRRRYHETASRTIRSAPRTSAPCGRRGSSRRT